MSRYTLTVTSKGQFTLPVEVRALMNVSTGDKLELFVTRDGSSVIRPQNKPASSIFGRGAAYASAEGDRETTLADAVSSRGAPRSARRPR